MKQSKKRMMTAAAVTAVVAASILGAAGCDAAGASTTGAVSVPDTIRVENVEGAGNTIAVTGQEEVKVVPDMAQIEYAVYTQADTADACQTENAENLNRTIETLKGLGVEETSIQTSAYGLNPIYDWNSGTQNITGYEMTTRITVSDIPIDQAGSILSESVIAGVNQIDTVSYFSSNYDASYQEALKGAIAVAQAKAQAIAEASGKSVVGIVNVEEYGYNPEVRYSNYSGSGARAVEETAAAAMDMGVMPGQVSVEAQVNVEFAIE